MIRRNRRSGFTLLELLVVVIIIGIMATFAIPALLGFLDRSREAEVFDPVRKCLTAAYLQFNESNAWPAATADITNAGGPTGAVRNWAGVTFGATDDPNAPAPINTANNIRVGAVGNHGHGGAGDHEVRGWIDNEGDVVIQVDRVERTGAQADNWVNIGS